MMKVTLDRFGTMTIAAETDIEAYALEHWLERNFSKDAGLTNIHAMKFDWSLSSVEKEEG